MTTNGQVNRMRKSVYGEQVVSRAVWHKFMRLAPGAQRRAGSAAVSDGSSGSWWSTGDLRPPPPSAPVLLYRSLLASASSAALLKLPCAQMTSLSMCARTGQPAYTERSRAQPPPLTQSDLQTRRFVYLSPQGLSQNERGFLKIMSERKDGLWKRIHRHSVQ